MCVTSKKICITVEGEGRKDFLTNARVSSANSDKASSFKPASGDFDIEFVSLIILLIILFTSLSDTIWEWISSPFICKTSQWNFEFYPGIFFIEFSLWKRTEYTSVKRWGRECNFSHNQSFSMNTITIWRKGVWGDVQLKHFF